MNTKSLKNHHPGIPSVFAVILLTIAGFLLVFIPKRHAIAADTTTTSVTDTQAADAARQDQLDEINSKIKAYKQLIALKVKQGSTLSDQIASLETQAAKLQSDIDASKQQIASLDDTIQSIATRINANQTLIEKQRKLLGDVMRSYYADQLATENAVAVFASSTVSDTLRSDEWTSETSDQLQSLTESIDATRKNLVAENESLKTKRSEADTLRLNLEQRNADLADTRQQKTDLLAKTQADEQKYNSLLARIETQKKELLDFTTASNIGELSASVKDYPAPDKKDWASTSWYFAQTDSRWADTKIGNSRSTMQDYGCAIASLSMVFRYYGSSIDPGKMAGQKIFYYDLIQWPGSWDPKINLTSSISHNNVSWSTIDSMIKKNIPVIVHINKKNGGGGHYVVITGKDSNDYIVHDPYFGPNLYLGTSRALVGKIGADSGTTVDQMIIYQQ